MIKPWVVVKLDQKRRLRGMSINNVILYFL